MQEVLDFVQLFFTDSEKAQDGFEHENKVTLVVQVSSIFEKSKKVSCIC